MSRILVLYGTTEGHTAKVARFLGDALRSDGASADVIDARTTWPSPANYDAVIVAASVHARGYHRTVRGWVHRHAQVLNDKPTAFVSVCLAVLQREPAVQRELAAIVDRFLIATGWRPAMTKNVAARSRYPATTGSNGGRWSASSAKRAATSIRAATTSTPTGRICGALLRSLFDRSACEQPLRAAGTFGNAAVLTGRTRRRYTHRTDQCGSG